MANHIFSTKFNSHFTFVLLYGPDIALNPKTCGFTLFSSADFQRPKTKLKQVSFLVGKVI